MAISQYTQPAPGGYIPMDLAPMMQMYQAQYSTRAAIAEDRRQKSLEAEAFIDKQSELLGSMKVLPFQQEALDVIKQDYSKSLSKQVDKVLERGGSYSDLLPSAKILYQDLKRNMTSGELADMTTKYGIAQEGLKTIAEKRVAGEYSEVRAAIATENVMKGNRLRMPERVSLLDEVESFLRGQKGKSISQLTAVARVYLEQPQFGEELFVQTSELKGGVAVSEAERNKYIQGLAEVAAVNAFTPVAPEEGLDTDATIPKDYESFRGPSLYSTLFEKDEEGGKGSFWAQLSPEIQAMSSEELDTYEASYTGTLKEEAVRMGPVSEFEDVRGPAAYAAGDEPVVYDYETKKPLTEEQKGLTSWIKGYRAYKERVTNLYKDRPEDMPTFSQYMESSRKDVNIPWKAFGAKKVKNLSQVYFNPKAISGRFLSSNVIFADGTRGTGKDLLKKVYGIKGELSDSDIEAASMGLTIDGFTGPKNPFGARLLVGSARGEQFFFVDPDVNINDTPENRRALSKHAAYLEASQKGHFEEKLMLFNRADIAKMIAQDNPPAFVLRDFEDPSKQYFEYEVDGVWYPSFDAQGNPTGDFELTYIMGTEGGTEEDSSETSRAPSPGMLILDYKVDTLPNTWAARNNNPANVTDKWKSIGVDDSGNKHAIFDTMQDGVDALMHKLRRFYAGGSPNKYPKTMTIQQYGDTYATARDKADLLLSALNNQFGQNVTLDTVITKEIPIEVFAHALMFSEDGANYKVIFGDPKSNI